MGNGTSSVSDSLLIQFGQIFPVLDQFSDVMGEFHPF